MDRIIVPLADGCHIFGNMGSYSTDPQERAIFVLAREDRFALADITGYHRWLRHTAAHRPKARW